MPPIPNMKPNPPDENEKGLEHLLHEWKVDSSLPPRFNEQVWLRIAGKERAATNPLAFLRNWFAHAAVRPVFAFSYAAVLLIAGLALGLWQAHEASQRTSESLSTRYVQMVDPYQMPHH